MTNTFKEQTFKGKPISELNKVERNQYRRYCQKVIKKSIKERQRPIKNDGSKFGNPKFGA